MTLPQVNHLTAYWKSHPPVHILVAGYMGIKPAPSKEEKEAAASDENLLAFIQQSAQVAGAAIDPSLIEVLETQ